MNHPRPRDPTKVNWDMMAAFGSDEEGNTYLQSILLFCCDPVPVADQIEDAVACARSAFYTAPAGAEIQCMLEALKQAGLVPLDPGAGEGNRDHGPYRASFFAPQIGRGFHITHHWGLQAAEN